MSKKDKKAEQTAPEQQEPMEETQLRLRPRPDSPKARLRPRPRRKTRAPIPSSPSWSP